jgi:hypothetical protein
MSTIAMIVGLIFTVLGNGSTIARNEFNCTLSALSDCRAPQIKLPFVPVPLATPSEIRIVPVPLAAPGDARILYDGVTGYANPSLGGR